MRLLVLKYLNRLRASFWFVPALMAAAAAILAIGGVSVDQQLTDWLAPNWGWKFSGGAEGASAVLGGIATSMINIAGVVFSMTLVALSLTSSQLGPRLLRSFMRDRTTQFVLGTFVATFVYCLLVLRTVRRAEEAVFVPHLSVGLGVVFAVAGVGVLIYFIHHVSISIQANEIAARIGRELLGRIDELFADRNDHAPLAFSVPPDPSLIDAFELEAQPVGSNRDGYLQLIDTDGLIEMATEEKLIIRLERRPGDYVVANSPLVSISPASVIPEKIAKRVQSMFVMGNQRTSNEDVEFAVNQLVEMAVRALSPGINDPFTAIACVDHLGSALCRLATRDMPSPYHYDRDDKLRLIGPSQTFGEVVDSAFNQIRQYGRGSASVTIRLLDTIAVIAGFVHRPEDRATLMRHADMILRGSKEGLPEADDRQVVEGRWQIVSDLCTAEHGH